MYRDKTALLFIMSTLVTGLCGAFFYPLSSLFIVEALDASPMQLSLYMVLAVVSSVIVSQWLARQSDRHWQRKTILLVSLICYLITVVSFMFIRSYSLAIMVVVLFASVSGASFGQLFALGREYADQHLTDKTTFLSTCVPELRLLGYLALRRRLCLKPVSALMRLCGVCSDSIFRHSADCSLLASRGENRLSRWNHASRTWTIFTP